MTEQAPLQDPLPFKQRLLKGLMLRVRLLPLVMFIATLMLSIKIKTFVTHVQIASLEMAELKATTVPENTQAKAAEEGASKDDKESAEKKKNKEDFDPLGMNPSEFQVLNELSLRREQLEKESAISPEKEKMMETLEKRIQEKATQLAEIEKRLKALVDQIDTKDNENDKRLVTMLESLKPEKAASVIMDVELDTLLRLMEKMSPKKVAAVLSFMEPEKASFLLTTLSKREHLFKKDNPNKVVGTN